MAQVAIIDKLRNHLSKPLDTEAAVVYLLVEVRKFLEQSADGGFATLRHYCNWAVHSKLDAKAATDIIKIFDDIQDAFINDDAERKRRLIEAAQDLLGVNAFQNELRTFLTKNGLDAAICRDAQWREFIELYLHVIADVPLVFAYTPIKHVKSVTVHLDKGSAFGRKLTEKLVYDDEKQLHYALEWRTELFDGKSGVTCHFNVTSPKRVVPPPAPK